MKRLFYISLLLFSVLITATPNVSGQDLPMVCGGSKSTYRVDGLANSIFDWTITDPNGNPLTASHYKVIGDVIEIQWPDSIGGIFTFSVVETSIYGCVGAPWDQQHIVLNTNTVYLPIQGNQEVFVACEGESAELDPGLFKYYLWSVPGADITRTYITTQEGTYQVRLVDFNQSCTYDTIQARFYELPTVWLGNDTILFANQTLELDAYNPDFIEPYEWYSNGSILSGETFSTLMVDGLSGKKTIKVIVTDLNGCKNSDEINIGAKDYSDLKIPSAFTPNGDAINDKWFFPRIDKETNQELINYIDEVDVKVYNRTGKMVWQSKVLGDFWDGKDLNGRDLPMDSYHYIIRFKISGHEYMYKGSITIIR